MATGRKTGGRQPGAANRTKRAFRERLQAYATRYKVDPHDWMVRCLADATTQVIGITDAGTPLEAPTVSVALKLQCARELAQYLQPKLRSIELTGAADSPVEVLHRLPQADLDALITRLLRQTGYPAGAVASEEAPPCP